MKRRQMCQRINRNNNTVFNHVNRRPVRVSAASPEILVGQIWLQDDEMPAVEVVEVNSSNNNIETSSHEHPNSNLSHAWSYVNNDRFQQLKDDYKVNEKARERRRMKIENTLFANEHFEPYNSYGNHWTRNNVHRFKSILHANDTKNDQTNCFTDINKNLTNSDTSSDNEKYADIEFIAPFGDCGDMITGNHMRDSDDDYDEQIVTYDPELGMEKRTILIYSFKNKRLLTDDFELGTISSNGSISTSSSIENMEEDPTYVEPTYMHRAASPIPATYIPRLDLSLIQTLSTVSEVTEPNKQSSNETEGSVNVILSQKPMNSWFASDIEGDGKLKNEREQSTNVINWMALSPRKWRRHFYNTNKEVKYQDVCSEVDAKADKSECSSVKIDKGITQIYVDVHDVNDSISEKKYVVTPRTTNTHYPIVETIYTEDTEPITETFSAEIEVEEHDNDEYRTAKCKPQIRPNTKLVRNINKISSPIEKLDSNNWILEETDEKQTAIYDYDSETIKEVAINVRDKEISVAQKLWAKNAMSLMKPVQWTAYLPIAESSLHLSLSTIGSRKKQSWFKRLIKCFNCFK